MSAFAVFPEAQIFDSTVKFGELCTKSISASSRGLTKGVCARGIGDIRTIA